MKYARIGGIEGKWRVSLSDIAAVSAQSRPSSEGRCIPRFQVYRMSAQTDRLLVQRLIRRDAPGSQRHSTRWGLKTSLGLSTRPGSRSSPRVWVRLMTRPFLGPRTELF